MSEKKVEKTDKPLMTQNAVAVKMADIAFSEVGVKEDAKSISINRARQLAERAAEVALDFAQQHPPAAVVVDIPVLPLDAVKDFIEGKLNVKPVSED